MVNIIRIGSIIALIQFFTCINSSLGSREIDIIIKGGKASCSSNLESGNVYDFHLGMPFGKKFIFQSGIEYYIYGYTFTSWGALTTLVPSKVMVNDFKVGLSFHHDIYSIKKTIFPYIVLSSTFHIIQTFVKPENNYSESLPPNVKPYEHSAKFVPGISANLGFKVVTFSLPLYILAEGGLSIVPAWNKYLIGCSKDSFITTKSFKVGCTLIISD